MESKKIIVNGTEVECFEDGSLEKMDRKKGKLSRTFGTTNDEGYKVFFAGGGMHKAHRLIFWAFNGEPALKGMVIDHIDGVKSNNTPSNLRELTNPENLRARRKKSDKHSSKFRGVCLNKMNDKWSAYCRVDEKPYLIGQFESEIEAAIAFDSKAIQSGYAKEGLNFPVDL